MTQTHIERIRSFSTAAETNGWHVLFLKDDEKITRSNFAVIMPNGYIGRVEVPESGSALIRITICDDLTPDQKERIAAIPEMSNDASQSATVVVDSDGGLNWQLSLESPDDIPQIMTNLDNAIHLQLPAILRALSALPQDAIAFPYLVYRQVQKQFPCRFLRDENSWLVAATPDARTFFWAFCDEGGFVNIATTPVDCVADLNLSTEELLTRINILNQELTFTKVVLTEEHQLWLDCTFFLPNTEAEAATYFDEWMELFLDSAEFARKFLMGKSEAEPQEE